MINSLPFLGIGFVIYIVASRFVMRSLDRDFRNGVMALLNLVGFFAVFFYNPNYPHRIPWSFACYFLIVAFQYVMLQLFSEAKGWLPWLAFFTPIAALLCFRYVLSRVFAPLWQSLGWNWSGLPNLVGLSYLAFRCSRLVLEIRNDLVNKPGFGEYISFAFFLPTMSVGPINTYANFRRGFAAEPWKVPVGRAALRILVGLVKYEFLGGIFDQLTYKGFLLNGHLHHWSALPIAMVSYYLFLYCNFSGFCDMAIGAAALIGIPVMENFNDPFVARNVKDFWNRWHISLSQYMRDVVFAPLSKFLARLMGPSWVNHAIALAITAVFLLIGIWHGVGWNFAAYGAAHALGVVTNHYYTIGLKKWLGRDGFKVYNSNVWIHAVAVVLTFCYCGASLFLFANTFSQMKQILAVLR